MIVKPSDIIYHIVGVELGRGSDVIDSQVDSNGNMGIDIARNEHNFWQMAFTVSKSINSKRLIENIAKESKLFPLLRGDKLAFNTLKDDYNSTDFEIKAPDVISINFDRTKVEDIRTEIVLHFEYDYGKKIYKDSTLNYSFDSKAEDFYTQIKGGYKKSFYGIDGEQGNDPIELNYIRDALTAEKLQRFLLAWYCNQHNTCTVKLPLSYLGAEVGDITGFDKEVNDVLLYGERYSLNWLNDVAPVHRNGQEMTPYWMVMGTKKSLTDVTLNLIQLHKFDDAITNFAPIADAGLDQTLYESSTIYLDGTGSYDPNGDPIEYEWVELSNNGVQLQGYDTAEPSFYVQIEDLQEYEFQLKVTDSEGAESLPDTCNVTVNPVYGEITSMNIYAEEPADWPNWPMSPGSLQNLTYAGVQEGVKTWIARFDIEQGMLPVVVSNPQNVEWYIKCPQVFPNYPPGFGQVWYEVMYLTPDETEEHYLKPYFPNYQPYSNGTFCRIRLMNNQYQARRQSADGKEYSDSDEPYPYITFHDKGTDRMFGRIKFHQLYNYDGEQYPPKPEGWGEGEPPGAVGAWSLTEEHEGFN